MHFTLRKGLTFCRVDDRLLFLDLPADRYFCLSRTAERSFMRLCNGDADAARDAPCLDGLVRGGLLMRADGAPPPAPCAPPQAAQASLCGTRHAVHVRDVSTAMLHLVLAPLELRLFGLSTTVSKAASRKRSVLRCASENRIGEITAAFEACATLISAHDRCLPQSLAVLRVLTRAGARAELVVAVKLGPFKAHAWVQCEDTLINERIEVTRNFTPILVV